MKLTFLSPFLLSLPLALFSQDLTSQEKMVPSQAFQSAKVVDVVEYPEGRPFDWVGRTPARVYDGYPFYDLTLQLGGQCYIVRYEAQTGFYPSAWKPGSTVKARRGKGVVYLLRYDGEEVPTGILLRC
jgi:hypothetical protein